MSSPYPCIIPVVHREYVGIELDELNKEVPAWDDPKPVKVITAKPVTTQALQAAGQQYASRQTTTVTMTTPPWVVPHVRDHFTLPDGNDYEVDEVTDCNMGFHGWQPGYKAMLKRITPKGRP